MTGLSRPRSAGNSCAVRASGGRWRYRDDVRILIRGLRSLLQYNQKALCEMQSAFLMPIFKEVVPCCTESCRYSNLSEWRNL
nr:MAG TPA: hypothetical protein [Caudoviricetes sp.]